MDIDRRTYLQLSTAAGLPFAAGTAIASGSDDGTGYGIVQYGEGGFGGVTDAAEPSAPSTGYGTGVHGANSYADGVYG